MVRPAATASTFSPGLERDGGARRRTLSRPWPARLAWHLAGLLAALLLFASVAMAAAPAAQDSAPAEPALTPSALADLLENADSRQVLIDRLRAQAPEGDQAGQAPDGAPAAQAGRSASAGVPPAAGRALPSAEASLQDRLTVGVQGFLASLADDMAQGVDDMQAIAGGASPGMDGEEARRALIRLGMAAAAAILAYLLLRLVAHRIYARMDRWVAGLGRGAHAEPADGAPFSPRVLYMRAAAIVGALAIDIGVVLLAALAGYGAGLYDSPGRGAVYPLVAVFLKAFLAVEITKVLIRTVFATRHPHLRLLPMADEMAVYWNAWLVRIVAVAGYGTMLIDPAMSVALSPALGRLVGLVIMLGVYVYAVRVIWRNRLAVRERMQASASRATTFFGSRLRLLARVWHILGIGYFTVLLVVSQIDPSRALPFMVKATVQTVLIVGVGSLLILLLNTLLTRPVRVSDDVRKRLPLLEARLNAYVPKVLRVVGWVIRVVVVLLVLDAWHAFNLAGWITSEAGAATIGVIVNVAIVLLIAALAWTVIASFIEHRLNLSEGGAVPSAREKTLLSLFRNAALIVIVTMTVMVVLSQIGIDVAPLIAGAGVVGLAVGFGAQKLVQDIITGVFIQLENGMNENDVVQVAGVFGTVERMTIRSVGIRTLDGGYHLIPFSSVDVVSNHMRDFSYHLGEYTISHRESVDDAIQHLRNAFAELMTDEVLAPEILEEITIPGVTAVNEKGVTIRVLIKTTPGMQWAVQRGYNRLVKKHFNSAGIEVPYPHMVVYFGQDKQGFSPAANVVVQPERMDDGEDARAAGHTRRPLATERSKSSQEVLGNELDKAVDEDGEPLERGAPGQA